MPEIIKTEKNVHEEVEDLHPQVAHHKDEGNKNERIFTAAHLRNSPYGDGRNSGVALQVFEVQVSLEGV